MNTEPMNDPVEYEGSSISFRMVCNDKPNIILTLFNEHNGYYSHGFCYMLSEKNQGEDSL